MRKSLVNKVIKQIFFYLPYLILVLLTVPIIGVAYTEGSKLLGLKTVPVPVVGTGSMYPSLFWAKSEGGPEDDNKVVIEEYRSTPHLYRRYSGFTLFGHKYFEKKLNRGDMVAFKNEKTREILKAEDRDGESGFIKRIIAVPGDVIELRDGFVYINGQLISEPYISTARSTYGGEFLKDCHKLTIPAGNYFVMGDNRKVSSDSRFELGLVGQNDIEYVLPLSNQQIYLSLWRDTKKDDESLGKPTLSSDEFINLVNSIRKDKNIPPLKSISTLIKSAKNRGEKLLQDASTNYGMKQSIADSGYSNIVLGEFVSRGNFSAKELLENLLYNTSAAKQILNREFSDLGVSAVNMDIDGCPSQIIVGHLGGYVPASYDAATLDSWKNLESSIESVFPSWKAAVGSDQIDQAKLNELLSIFNRRLELAKEIVYTMEQKKWLTDAQQAKIKSDEKDATVSESLMKELNKQ